MITSGKWRYGFPTRSVVPPRGMDRLSANEKGVRRIRKDNEFMVESNRKLIAPPHPVAVMPACASTDAG